VKSERQPQVKVMEEIPAEVIGFRSDDGHDRDRVEGSVRDLEVERGIDAFTERTDYPLVVVTATSPNGECSGCLAGFLTQCSIEPPRFLVCISKVNHTFDVVTRSEVIALHLLGEDQHDVASLFGETTGDKVDKFAGIGWRAGPLGVPLLDECAAWLVVGIVRRVNAGDHVALMTYPIVGGPGSRPGLLTLRSAPPLQAGHPAD
jgi:flavin reductase (DIM6/NTAB) family NADH-FMN oxidoreductase RutF